MKVVKFSHAQYVLFDSDSKLQVILRDKTCVRGSFVNDFISKRTGDSFSDIRADIRHTSDFVAENTVRQERNQSQMKRLLSVASSSTWTMTVAAANARFTAALYRASLQKPRAGVIRVNASSAAVIIG